MSEDDLKTLIELCSIFRGFTDTTADGNGNNLHDIKVTFDYVKKTAENYNLVGTSFGNDLVNKVEKASDVLVRLSNCYKNLEASINNFVEIQRRNNSGNSINAIGHITFREGYK